jgi:hypothetical protein
MILDCLIASASASPPESIADCELITHSKLWTWVTKTVAAIASGIERRLAFKLQVFFFGRSLPDEGKLSHLLRKKVKVKNDNYSPLSVMVTVKGVRILTVRTPVLADGQKRDGYEANLAVLLSFACKALDINVSNLRVVPDTDLGSEVRLPAEIGSLISNMVGNLESSLIKFNGEIHELPSGFKGNLVDILAAIYELRRHEDVISRPVKILASDKDQKTTTTTELMEVFNIRTGLKQTGSIYSANLMRSILGLLTRGSNKHFPSRWLHGVREQNGVKSSEGLLSSLGWDCTLPSQYKFKTVLFTDCFEKGNGFVIKPISAQNYPDGLGWKELRSAIVFALPFLDPQPGKPVEEQLRYQQLGGENKCALRFFKQNRRLVATLNKAFGTLQAVKSSKGKTSPKFYQALRNKVLADTANITFLDKTGREYPSLASLPEHLQGWFKKTFLYKKVQEATKRPAQDSSDQDSSPQKEKKDNQPPKKRKVEEKKVIQVDPVTPKHAPKPKPRKAAKKKVVEPDNSIAEVTMGDSQPIGGDFTVTSVPWLIEPTGENKVFVNTVNGIASATLSRGSDEDAVRLVYDHAIETSNAFVNAMQVFLDAGEIEIAPGNALVFSQKANERFASVVEAAGGNSGPFTGARGPSAAHRRK